MSIEESKDNLDSQLESQDAYKRNTMGSVQMEVRITVA